MLFMDADGNLVNTENPHEIAFRMLVQELNLYKDECPINTEAGVNYQGVLNGEAFLKVEVQDVIDKHISRFKSITVGDPVTDPNDREKVTMSILILRNDGERVEFDVGVRR